MKRQRDSNIATRVYSYGCVPVRIAPVQNTEAAAAQLRLAGRLWNTLVAIEHTRIAVYRRIMHDAQQERIDTLREQLAAYRAEIQARRKAARAKRIDTIDLAEPIANAKAEMSALIVIQKETKDERHDLKRTELTMLEERSNRRVKKARQAAANMGLFWGSYNDIVQRMDAGRKHHGELRFQKFTGDGTLTAQIIGGAKVERSVGGNHTFFQIDRATPGQRWRYARMRIGSNADRSPVWLEIPIVYHRELPVDGDIKSVSMSRRTVDGKIRWQLNVTVNTMAPILKQGIAVGIDIGWRLLPEGVRVAYWEDEYGVNDQMLMAASDLEQFGKVRSLRSICDRSRDEFLPALVEWLDGREIPEPWQERSRYLAQWKSTDRLADLVRWWSDNRLDSDEEIFTAASDWRRQYLHLAHWWRNLQDQMTLRLREQYRVFAAGIASRYGVLCVESFDLRSVAEKPQPEETAVVTQANAYRQIVSPSMFRGALLNACKREGVEIIMVDAAYTTRNCHRCGHMDDWAQAESVHHRCSGCGTLWDQDRNAAINILRLGMNSRASGSAVMALP
jgi:hypothetical protein